MNLAPFHDFLRRIGCRGLALLAAGSLSACSYHVDDYPSDWPKQQSQWFGCPNLSGSYEYKGQRSIDGSGKNASLPLLPTGIYSNVVNNKIDIDRISIASLQGNDLHIEAYSKGKLFYSGNLTDKNFTNGKKADCNRGVLSYQWGRGGDYKLSLTVDGSLISRNGFLDCLFLFCKYEATWSRFMPYRAGD